MTSKNFVRETTQGESSFASATTLLSPYLSPGRSNDIDVVCALTSITITLVYIIQPLYITLTGSEAQPNFQSNGRDPNVAIVLVLRIQTVLYQSISIYL